MKKHYKRLGDYIQLVDERNTGMEELSLVGLSISKQFINSVANIIGTDLSNYKIIRRSQFACSLMQVSRDEKIPIAMFTGEKSIMSPAYPIFEVRDTSTLLPQYLMMWFERPEFDRQASFYAVGGVRGNLPWEDFLELEIPIPPITKQREIVKEYNTIQNRINLNNQLIQKLEETAQVIYNEMFVKGLDLENLPEGWRAGYLNELCEYSNKRISLNDISIETYISTENMLQDKAGITLATGLPTAISITNFEIGNILISNIRPYFKKIWLANFSGGCSNDVLCFVPKPEIPSLFLYQIIEKDNFFDYVMAGSKGTKMPRGDKKWIMNYETVIPSSDLLVKFKRTTQLLQKNIQLRKKENQKLAELKDLLLSKLTTVEN